MTFSFPSCIATASNLAMPTAENRSMRLASTPLLFVIACLLPALAQAAPPTPLRNGLNRVDFTGDGKADLVVIAHRENFNAHGFDVVSFHANDGGLLQVPLFDGDDEAQFATISGGADCVLHDLRLLPGKRGEPATLVRADRVLGDSYAADAEVTFTWYALRRNVDSDVGYPEYRFERTRKTKAEKAYCDVGDAFAKELGLPATSAAGGR
jgi:hypothetical protein